MPQRAQLVITVDTYEDGRQSISAGGPLENKMLCYGMLEMARDIVQKHEASGIVAPPPGPLPRM